MFTTATANSVPKLAPVVSVFKIGVKIVGPKKTLQLKKSRNLTIVLFSADPTLWCFSTFTRSRMISGMRTDMYTMNKIAGR